MSIDLGNYLLFALGINMLMFIFAFIFKTDKLTDLSYSVTFVFLIVAALGLNDLTSNKLLLAVMIAVWALRLGTFLFIRILNMKQDKRFDGMRESFFRFLKFWILQGLAVWAILIPSLFFIISDADKVAWAGLGIWVGGLILETVADIQKYTFKQNQLNKGKFMQSGIWKYSRHPNYFGEILCWVGIYVFVLPSLTNFQKIAALVSPIFIILLLLFVTGIPLLERSATKKWGNQKKYQEYVRKTSILIPWIPKK